MTTFISSDPSSIRNAENSLYRLGEQFRLSGQKVSQNPEIGQAAAEIAAARMRLSAKPEVSNKDDRFIGANNTLSM